MSENTRGTDRVLGPSASLSIMLLLYGHKKVQFSTLQRLLGLTPGNLNYHLGKLAEEEYIVISKKFFLGRFLTVVTITAKGRVAFKRYVERFKAILKRIEAES